MGYRWSSLQAVWLRFASALSLRQLPLRLGLLALMWGLILPFNQPAIAQEGDRRFRQNLCIEYLTSLELPSQSFDGTTIGGLSALTYDPKTGLFYALSDDRSQAHLYEFTLPINQVEEPSIAKDPTTATDTRAVQTQLGPAEFTRIIRLKDSTGQPYSGSFDPEGLALTPQDSFYVSTEGDPSQGLAPGLFEFDRSSGELVRELPVPEKFKPAFEEQPAEKQPAEEQAIPEQAIPEQATPEQPVGTQPPEELPVAETKPTQIKGVQTNQGFESLSLSATGTAIGEPLRLFSATEGPLTQDTTAASINGQPRNRLLHYYLGEGRPLLVAEHLYPLSPLPGSIFHGLSEILALDGEGHFLALERALTPLGFDAKLFQVSLAGASDISGQASLRGSLRDIQPIQKQLLLDLSELGIALDNLEGMTWGPRLSDGSRSLLLISDDNFKSFQRTQILLFKFSQS